MRREHPAASLEKQPMPDAPWTPDVVVSPALAASLIDAQLPALAPVRLALLGQGWDNTAYLANDELVFRFPRRRIAYPLLEAEIRLLPRLAPRLSIPIPHPTFIGRMHDPHPWPFAGYPLLPGRTACSLALSDAQRTSLAAPLGRFLAELHAFPAAQARALGATGDTSGKLDLPRCLPVLHERLDRLQHDLPAQVAAARRLVATLPRAYTARADTLVHGDLYARHILIHDAGGACTLAGVIDWGDVHVGDRAVDLSLAWSLLPPAAHGSFCHAYGDIDAATWAMARFRALWSGTALVIYATEIGDIDLAREGRVVLGHVLDQPSAPLA